jgi:hypothetical protein
VKKTFFLFGMVGFVFYFLVKVSGFVFAEIQVNIPNDPDNFKYGACNNKGFQCSGGTVINGVIPNVTTELCDTGWTPVCFYDPEGNYDVTVPMCSCRKLQVEENNPATYTSSNTCICESGSVKTNECDSGMVPTCNTSDYTVGVGTANCLCLTEEVSQQQQQLQNPDNSEELSSLNSNLCVETALGCVPYTTEGFTVWLLKILFGISGGIAFLLMVYGFILMATSAGDEKKVQGAKETITSAITGLLVSIFALFIFRLIAIDILQIPGIG